MKTKSLLSLLSLAASVSFISGCNKVTKDTVVDSKFNVLVGENGEVVKLNDPEDPANSKLSSIECKTQSMLLFIDKDAKTYESKKIDIVAKPYGVDTSNFVYTSSNEKIAKVDSTGKVTAVGAGKAEITVASYDGAIFDTCHVCVNETTIAGMVGSRKNQIFNKQSQLGEPENIKVTMEYVGDTKKNQTEVTETTEFTQTMWISKKNAYFRITSQELEAKVTGGSNEPGRADYIFYTDKLFFTYAIKTDGAKKNYMRIDGSSFRNSGKTAYDAMLTVIDNFFTSGKKIITNQFEDLSGSDIKSDVWNSLDLCGRLTDGSDNGQLGIEYSNTSSGTLGSDDADSFDLPVGTYVEVTDTIRVNWEENWARNRSINEKIAYELDTDSYVNEINVDYYFDQIEVADLYKPDLKQYNRVDSIFDL